MTKRQGEFCRCGNNVVITGNGRDVGMILSVVVGFIIGAFFGSSIGIAGFGSAIAGTIPFGLLGAYIGYRVGQRRNGKIKSAPPE